MSSTATPPAATRSRCGLVMLASTAALWGVAAVLVGQLVGSLRAAATGSGVAAAWSGPPEDAVVRLCLLALLLAVVVAWLQTVAAVRDARRGHEPAQRPGLVRRVVLAACGVAVVSALASVPAYAEGGPHDRLSGLPMPDRATGAPRSPAAGGSEVVRPGDTLWSLARARLGPTATGAAVAREWRRTYRANRTVVGADPDLIRPGQRLVLPRSTTGPKEPS